MQRLNGADAWMPARQTASGLTPCSQAFSAGTPVLLRRRNSGKRRLAAAGPGAAELTGTASASSRQPQFPPYTLVRRTDYDLRLYEPHTVLQCSYTRREEGYLALSSYKDGANERGTRFALTQPVIMCYEPCGAKRMQLFIGSCTSGEEAGASPPAPTEAAVQLAAAGGEIVAVLPFGGFITAETAEAMRQKLLGLLQRDGLKLAEAEAGGFFRVAQYGQVHTLNERLNELMLRVVV